MRSSRRTVLTAALFAPALLSHRTRAAAQKIIKAVPIGDLKVLDPIWSTAYITRNHAYMVWDTLFALDAQNRPQPQMVESYQASADGLTYTFTLRPGLLWHDGGKVTATDCTSSIKRWAAKDGMGKALMAVTADLTALDEKTFRLRLIQPVGFVIDALAKIDSNVPFMMPARLAGTDPNIQVTEMIGSGPFRFNKQAWVPGVKVVYDKFADYVPRDEPASQAAGGKRVMVDRVDLHYTPDSSMAAAALITGEFDLLENPAPDLVPLLKRSAGVTVRANDPLGYQLFMALNHLQPPFDNLAVRQAVLMATRQSEFMQGSFGDNTPWRECPNVFGCTMDATPDLGWPAYDLNKAKALLASSGYDGRPVIVMDPTDQVTLHPGALIAADTLRRLGMTVDLQSMDWSTLTVRRAQKTGWNLFVSNSTVTGIATPLLDNYVKQCENAWYGWPCDRHIADLTRAWGLEPDTAVRDRIQRELERAHLEQVTLIPVGQVKAVIALRNTLTGIIPGPALFYWNIDKA
jgi:peptide/nickel transport system substrate-binding protein